MGVIFRPHAGAQELFLSSGARDIFYGGAAGGGKSVCLISAGLRFFHLPGYRGKLFRRTRKMATELFLKANRMVTKAFPRARWNGIEHAFINPSGGRLEIGYLRHDADLENEEGQEYQFCVAKGTPILMADGRYKAIEDIACGDLVMTLQGPSRVSLRTAPRRKRCLSVTVGDTTVVAGHDHKVLTASGWVALEALTPIGFLPGHTTPSASRSSRRGLPRLLESLFGGLKPTAVAAAGSARQAGCLASDAWPAGVQSGSAGFDGSPPGNQQPRGWFVQLMLHAPTPPSAEPAAGPETPPGEASHGPACSSVPGSPVDCRCAPRSGDAPPRRASASAADDTPSPVDAASRSQPCSHLGGQEKTPGHTHTGTVAYCHPYTKASLCSSEAVRPGQALLAPAGEVEVYDLRVERHSHYITSGGIISQNCGFDELCQFPEHQAKFLHSRLRSADNIPLQYKGTGNPRGIGMLWVKSHYVDPAPPEQVHWYSFKAPDGRVFKSSVQFIPGRLEDNPSLGEDYELSLASIGNPKLYQALRLGDWNALIGDAFPDWDPEMHVISWADFAALHGLVLQIRPDGSEFVDIPKHWPIFMSYDWGTARPFSVGWWTADTYGRLYRIYEWYGSARTPDGKTIPNQGLHMSTRDQARGILQREEEWGIAGRVSMRLADPSVRNSHARKEDIPGPSVQEIMAEERVYLTLANNDRIQGKTQVHERLRISEFLDENGSIEETPGMMVLSHCKDWLRTVPTAPVSPVNPEDVDKTAELHAYDETRYMLMGRPWKARYVSEEKGWSRMKVSRRSSGDVA